MRMILLAVAFPLLAIAGESAPVVVDAATSPSTAPVFPSVQIEIEPGSDTGSFNATVRVYDLNSRRILASPQLQFTAGSSASTEIVDDKAGFKIRVEAQVDVTSTSASWNYTISEQGLVIAESRATISLARPRDPGY